PTLRARVGLRFGTVGSAPVQLRARARTVAALIAALLLGACGAAPEPPRWISLARGFEPRPLAEQVAGWERAAGALAGTVATPLTPGMSLTRACASSDWQRAEPPGCFAVPIPAGAFRASGAEVRLVGRGREFARVDSATSPAPGEF